ncbi:MAG: hypothetical protein ABR981_04235 [Candidatus Micrarchaeaceae archaeon]
MVISPYAIKIPSNVLYYLPINVINQNSIPVGASTPIAIGITANQFNTANVMGFNALKYQRYYTCNLNNAEFFFANGTVATSWLEGNVQNELAANAACTGTSSTNALYNSENVLYWVLIPGNEFLPANTGIAVANTIYLGWTGNVISQSNVLLGGPTGEAPQLSCSNPWSTYACSGIYGQYDNGQSIFNFYDNFSGSTLSPKWNLGIIAPDYSISNGIVLTPASFFGVSDQLESQSTYNKGNITDMLGNYTTNYVSGQYYTAGFGFTDTFFDFIGGGYSGGNFGIGSSEPPYQIATETYPSTKTPLPFTVEYNLSGDINFYYDYQTELSTPSHIPTFPLGVGFFLQSGSATTINAIWIRSRSYPPNGILPSTATFSAPIASPNEASLSLSNTLIDQGQSILFTATFVSGSSPYTYNYQIVNTITGNTVANMLFTGCTITTNTFLWTPPITLLGNSLKANVIITDANALVTSSAYYTIGYNSAINTPSLYQLNTNLDQGQSQTIAAYESGGTGPYAYNFLVFNSVTNTLLASQSSASNTFTFITNTVMAAQSPLKANVLITDSATTIESANSINSANAVVNSLTLSIIPSINPIQSGNSETFTFTIMGGTGKFNVALYNVTSGSSQIGKNVLIFNSGGTNSVNFSTSTGSTGITLNYNASATDGGTTTPFTFNATTSIRVYPYSPSLQQSGGGYCHPYPNCIYPGSTETSTVVTTTSSSSLTSITTLISSSFTTLSTISTKSSTSVSTLTTTITQQSYCTYNCNNPLSPLINGFISFLNKLFGLHLSYWN